MGRGKAFVEVLDEAMAGYEPGEPVHTSRTGLGYATPSILFFDIGLRHAPRPLAPGLPSASSGAPASRGPAPVGRSSVPFPRPRRTLSSQEQEALDAFVQLGADMGDDFTDAELRSVFRLLALRYHPDRHPGTSDREKARLSVCFAQLHDAYETLKTTPVSSN
jgi:DnaJ domain